MTPLARSRPAPRRQSRSVVPSGFISGRSGWSASSAPLRAVERAAPTRDEACSTLVDEMITRLLTDRQQHLGLFYEHTPKFSRLDPGSAANRSSTRPTRCSPSAATTRSRSRTSPAPPVSRAGSCTTTSAAANRSTSRCSSGSAPCARNNYRRPWAAAPARAWPTTCRAGSTGPNRTARSGSARSGAAKTSPTPTSGRVVVELVRRAVALVAAHHADIAQDSPRLRYALECWTGLNRAATRRWLQGEATREQTHELIASTLEHVLRTFGTPPKPRGD